MSVVYLERTGSDHLFCSAGAPPLLSGCEKPALKGAGYYIACSGNHPFICFANSKALDGNLCEELQTPGATGTAMKIHQCSLV